MREIGAYGIALVMRCESAVVRVNMGARRDFFGGRADELPEFYDRGAFGHRHPGDLVACGQGRGQGDAKAERVVALSSAGRQHGNGIRGVQDDRISHAAPDASMRA